MSHESTVAQSSVAGSTILRPAGDIDMSCAPAIRKAVAGVMRERPGRLIMDLSAVSYMDSSGIATLVEALQQSMRNKMKFVLVGVTPQVRSAFEITKLVSMFTMVATIDDATKD